MDQTSYNGQIEAPEVDAPQSSPPTEGELKKMRAEMGQTRAAMAEKVEAMEDKVLKTVKNAKGMVEETVSNVKEKVEDTMGAVKQTFDLRYQTQQRPWLMVGASVAVGFAAGSLLCQRSRDAFQKELPKLEASPPARAVGSVSSMDQPKRPSAMRRLFSRFVERFGDEIESVESAAIGAMMGLARDWLKKELPTLAPQLQRAMDSATTKLGGEPIPASVLHGHQTEEQMPRQPR